ncbi:MAG: FAD-binding protein [Dehalococcoidia bacterium]
MTRIESAETTGAATSGVTAVRNWGGDVISWPQVRVDAHSVDDLVRIMKDTEAYPSPVRAVGSNHSTSECGTASNGTLVNMRTMNRILKIDEKALTVTVEAGALLIDVAKDLEKRGLQMYVHIELGNLSLGAGATSSTKESSFPGEFGQVSSYAIGIKMVTAAGELVEVTEDQPELLQATRLSYGLFGIVYEVTYRIKKLQAMKVYNESYSISEFCERLPELKARGESMMFYIAPFERTIVVEYRSYDPSIAPDMKHHWRWKLRNLEWKTMAPGFSHFCSTHVSFRPLRNLLISLQNRILLRAIVMLIHKDDSLPADQVIRYGEVGGKTRYTFGIWVFPADLYVGVLKDYEVFVRDYERKTGFRCDMIEAGYSVAQDQSSLLSYSFDGPVLSVDPVCTPKEGWEEFLVAYNEFCSQHGGYPLFNQTKSLARHQVHKAYGDRIGAFLKFREQFDPTNRLFSPYFRDLLA